MYLRKDDIIAGHVGAEKSKKKKAQFETAATRFCDLIDDSVFWKQLELVVDDLEPITYMTNINQADTTRPDHVAVTFGGIWLHFDRHKDPVISAGMKKVVERRWRALDQPVYILALVLNPFEMLERFGDKACVDMFRLSKELKQLYIRIMSRPPSDYLPL